MFKIIDNYLGKEENEWMKASMLDRNFPWSIHTKTGKPDLDGYGVSPLDNQVCHYFVDNNIVASQHLNVIQKITNKFNAKKICRVKANCELARDRAWKSRFHWDQEYKDRVPMHQVTNAIYYLNSNNGYTEFKDGVKVESVCDRLLIFSNNMMHRGVSQTDCMYRIVINFNLELDETQ
jgi:hypothetical protein